MTLFISRRADTTCKLLAIVLSISAASTSSFAQTVTTQEMQPVIVTANRTPQKAGDVLSDAVTISAEEIQRSGQTSLVDLLQSRRGIEVTRNGGTGSNASVFLRGSNSNQVVLLIDGVRSVSSTVGTPDWSTVPLSSIDHIEVVLGPLATLYGADAVGGVIQVFTKKGGGAPHLSASAGTGSYGEQVVTASVSGSTSGEHTVRYTLNASTEKADGFSAELPGAYGYNSDKDGYDKKSVSGQLSWNLAKGQEIGLSFLNSRNESQFDNSATFDSRTTNEVNTYSIYSRNQLATNWTSLLQLSRSYTNGHTEEASGFSKFDSRQDVASWQNDIKFGNDLLQVIAEHRLEHVSSSEAALNRERTTDSLALAYQHRQGAHLVSASVRADDNSDYGNHTTASIGYGYNFNSAWRLATSYGTSYRAPTFNELYYPKYGVPTNQPEKGKNAEIGLHYDNGQSTFNAVYFHNRISDLLVTAYPPDCPAGYSYCAKNVEDALLEGISLSVGTKLDRSFVLNGSLDLQNPHDETTDKLLQRRAKVHGNISLDYVAGAWAVGSAIDFSSYRYDDAKNTATKRLGGYTLLNLHATYQINKAWQVFARWNNVFDKSYTLAQGYQTTGSNAFIGMRYGFN